MLKICWLTVNYYQVQFIQRFVESIHDQSVRSTNSIYIIDNSGEAVDGLSCAVVLRPGKNIGYFPAFNFALNSIEIGEYDYIIFSNPDVRVSSDFVEVLEKLEIRCNEYIIAPKILAPTGKNQNPHMLTKPSELRLLYYKLLYFNIAFFLVIGFVSKIFKKLFIKRFSNEEMRNEIYLAHGSFFITTKGFWGGNSKLHYDLFLWGEEVYLGNQARCSGGKIIYSPALSVFHDEHSATKLINLLDKFKLMKAAYKKYRDFL